MTVSILLSPLDWEEFFLEPGFTLLIASHKSILRQSILQGYGIFALPHMKYDGLYHEFNDFRWNGRLR